MTVAAIAAAIAVVLMAGWLALWRHSRFRYLPATERPAEARREGTLKTVFFPAQDGTRLEGWLYQPHGNGAAPLVIMAPGLGGTKEGMHEPFAWRFAAAGIAVLSFDFRCFGGSDGLPRHWVDPARHVADYKAALSFARTGLGPRGEIDATRIALWGSSFSGGTALCAAADDRAIAALVAQCPYLETPPHIQPRGLAMIRFVAMVMLDLARIVPAVYIPLYGRPGEWVFAPSRENPSVHDFPGTLGASFWRALPTTLRGGWENRMLARALATLDAVIPAQRVADVRCPTLLVAARHDDMVPFAFVEAAHAALPGPKEMQVFDCGHFDLYNGLPWAANVEGQVRFLAQHLESGFGTRLTAPDCRSGPQKA